MGPKPRPLIERFMAKVRKTKSCWEWLGATQGSGYGMILDGTTKKLAHRVSYELATESRIPRGKLVLHSCDNPGCVNPEHLFLGTQRDNTRDRATKLRDNYTHPGSKLTPGKVRDIVKRYISGETQSDIAAYYHISSPTVSQIIRGKIWVHVTEHIDLPGCRRKNCRLRRITENDVREIRGKYAAGETQQSLADFYGVSKSLVQQIVTNRAWAWAGP